MFKKKFLAIWIVALLFLSVGSYGLVRRYVHQHQAKTRVQQQQAAGNRIKQQVANNAKNKPTGSSGSSGSSSQPAQSPTSPTLPTTTPTSPSSPQYVAMSITALEQTSSELQIRTQINTITSDGSCNLLLTNGTQNVTQTAGVQALATVSTCKGFNVPLSSLSTGNWTAKVSFSNTTLSGSTAQQVTIH